MNKVVVIKVVCGVIGLGLKEVKVFVDGVLVFVKEVVFKEEVEVLKKEFEEVGVIVEVK